MVTNSFEEVAYLYFHCLFKQEEIKRFANGGAQENLSQELICAQPIIIIDSIDIYKSYAEMLRAIINYSLEIANLQDLLILYHTKLSNL